MSRAVIVAARRTPIATAYRGPMASLGVERLAAPVLRALIDDAGLDAQDVDDVILGNCTGPGGNLARVAALAAGLGTNVPGVTVDRQCGSGLDAINLATGLVEASRASVILAGGAESASTAPQRSIDGVPYARARFAPPPFPDPEMGEAADALAARSGITRERQDAYAARSHACAVAARAAHAREIVPVAGVEIDDRPRAGLTEARLARMPPAFAASGTVTAGNSCGVNDGAAFVAVVSESVRAAHHLPGLRVVDWEVVGCDPALPGLGPVPAIQNLLHRQGLELPDIGAIEIVEAFAGQVLACADALGLDPARICRDGGAIALGHPWGASGAVLMVRLFCRLVREDEPGFGLAAVAIGGGMGIATLVERVG